MSRKALANLAKAGLKMSILIEDTIPDYDELKDLTKEMIHELCIYHWNDPDWSNVGAAEQCLKCPVFKKRHKEMPPQILGKIKEFKGDLDENVINRLFGTP